MFNIKINLWYAQKQKIKMVVIYNQWQLTFNLSDCPFRSALTFFHQTFGPFTDLTEKLAGFQVFRSRAQSVLSLTSIVKRLLYSGSRKTALKSTIILYKQSTTSGKRNLLTMLFIILSMHIQLANFTVIFLYFPQ